ncbi:dermonecrotic toxin domain-containing protein [Pseudomonas sp. NBRC 111119]|uniref:dermonecrotic toxin domain-containing protein n=1 Tax=Pseudomonas sp. NBRC 111119 TaxID=1661034 RepID=UPI00076123D2|nr:DUF6543 domain-containing protein [Pseudomonas sp. NBRC 111119]
MPDPYALPTDFKALVAAQFASRPTLRQVLSTQIMQLLIQHYPLIKAHRPELTDADRLGLALPSADGQRVSTTPLVDVALQALYAGTPLNFSQVAGQKQYLKLDARRFFAIPDPLQTAEGDQIELAPLTQAFNDLLLIIWGCFNQAQVDYWRADGSAGVSRDRWLQQMIRSATLYNLPLQGLRPQQQACVRGLLRGAGQRPSVFFVQIEATVDGKATSRFLPDLLVYGQWDEADVVLWCKPAGTVWGYPGFDAFAQALQAEYPSLASHDNISWHRHELEGDPFSQQAAMLLECMLEQVGSLRRSALNGVTDLEQACLALTDPAQWFIEGYVNRPALDGKPPRGLLSVAAPDSFACQRAFYELALAQAESDGVAALDGVLDLHGYASQQLREQLLHDHPVDANYFPDDLQLELTSAFGVPGGAGVGAGDGALEKRTLSLTQFAIANLSSLEGATITAITHREGQLIMGWMTADYAKALVQCVDVGGNYPTYVASKLNEPTGLVQRVQRFAREWRCDFMLRALRAKLHGSLDESTLQAICDYCSGQVDPLLPASMLMPFALRRAPDSQAYDVVRGMYVLFNAEPGSVVLYRPLYGKAAVLAFASIEAMMQAVRDDQALQASLLAWLAPEARHVYANGGFTEPHLGGAIVDTSILPAPVAPAQFWPRFWRSDVDLQMYTANRDLLVELADRNSVSNAESRWAILTQGAWLLFDVASLVVRGPAAVALWLVQMFNAASADLQAIREGSDFERSAAVVDMLLNLVMVVGHAYAPRLARHPATLPDAMPSDSPGPGSVRPVPATGAQMLQGKVYLPGALEKSGALLDFSFSGGEGFNVLPAQMRKRLEAMRVDASLEGVEPLQAGDAAGLYRQHGQYYVKLRGDTYRVAPDEHGVRIVDALGNPGPWLQHTAGAWRIDHGLRLSGGMPRGRVELMREQNVRQEARMRDEDARLTEQRKGLVEAYERHKNEVDRSTARIEELERLAQPDEHQQEMLSLQKQLRRGQRQYLANDLKQLVAQDTEHDRVLMERGRIRLSSQVVEDAIRRQRSTIREGLIATCETYYNLLATMINEEDIDGQHKAIALLPETDEEKQQYQRLVKSLERVWQWGSDMVALSAQFDPLLESTLKDNDIVFRDENGRQVNKHHELSRVIQDRRLNAIDLEFRLLEDLGELALNRLNGTSEAQLDEYYEMLAGDNLRSAGSAHGELAGSGLTDEERVAVLNDVIDSYEETIGRAEYLASVEPAEIRPDKLQLFLQVLRRLKDLASEEMAASVRELEQVEAARPRTPVYAARGGVRRLVRTHRGRSVVGIEAVGDDGVAEVQQRDSHDKVLRTFRRQNSQWWEVQGAPQQELAPARPHAPEVLRNRLGRLIDSVGTTLVMAKRFFSKDEPLGLSTVIDQHIKDLRDTRALLPRTASDKALAERAQAAVDELEDSKQELLKTHYLTSKAPTLNALKFLHGIGELTVARVERRVELSPTDYLDTYEIKRVSGKRLWEAHFHYPGADTPDRNFQRGHLKLWEQRKLGHQAVLRAARRNEVLRVYRGQLRKGDVEGIIPFE